MSTQTKINPVVSSHGYSSAEILFLAGFPSKRDIENGAALTGHAEATLNQFLYPNKLNLKQCYRSCFIKERLEYSGTNTKKLRLALEKVNYEGYLNLLFEEIKDVSPNVIVPLDDIALAAVFPHIQSLHKPRGRKYWIYCYRGSILPLRSDFSIKLGRTTKLIPTFHPNYLEVDWTARSYVGLDFKRIKEHSLSTQPIEEFGLCWVARTAQAFEEFLRRQYAKKPTRVSFDIETYGGIPTCISFCYDSYESVTVPLLDESISPTERALLWRLVGKCLADKNIEKNNQNIKYDWTILERFGFKVSRVLSDTMLKGALLYPELPKGLDFYTSIYTPVPYYKDEGKEFNPKLHTRDRLYLYCAKDSLTAQIISEKQDEELIESGMADLYNKEVAPLIMIYKNIDVTGIMVDHEQKNKLHNKYEYLYHTNLTKLRALTDDDSFNPRSPAQVGRLIYENLKYPVRKHTLDNGVEAYNTGKEILDDLLINYAENNRTGKVGANILQRIILCRKLGKVIEYIETPLHPDGTFRGSSNLAGTETGRSSFSKTIDEIFVDDEIKRVGRSLQTITKHGFTVGDDIFEDIESNKIANDLRSMFVPPRDFYFVEGDGKGAEARVVFVLAEDYDALAAMDSKPSLHAKTIGLILDIDPNTITKTFPAVPQINVPYYELGKRIRHAGHNGMGPFRLSLYIHQPLSYCTMLMNKFHSTNPLIQGNFHGPVVEFVKQHRHLTCPNSRRRDFFSKLTDKHNVNEILCYIQQATVSDLTKFTMPRIVDALPGYMTKYMFLTEQHDGILAAVHKDIRDEYLACFKYYYERPINFNRCSLSRDFELSIPAELSISNENWQNLEEVKMN